MNTNSIPAIAIAVTALVIGSLAATGEASAEGGVHGGRHGAFAGRIHTEYRWHGRHIRGRLTRDKTSKKQTYLK